MPHTYANLTVVGPSQADLVAHLKRVGTVAYVSPTVKGATVIYHEDLASQQPLAAELSEAFACPVLLVMTYATRVLLYELYESGRQTDAYVSEPHEDLALDPPPGDAGRLADVFNKPSAARRVETILRKLATPGSPYEHAGNRHGDLVTALGLPVLAVAASFGLIEMGELPGGPGFDPGQMVRLG
jgi:hypothetical protein